MLTMAGAAGTETSYRCKICNKDTTHLSSVVYNVITMKEAYGLDNIPSLGESLNYEEASDGYRFFLIVEDNGVYDESFEICTACVEKIVSEYKSSISNSITCPGTGTTPITVTAEAFTFNVTVPTSIPLVVNADGMVTAPTGVKLENGSAGSVQVSSIAMNNGDWSLTDYNSGNRSKLAEAKVDSKKLGLSLAVTGNAAVTSKDGSQTPAMDSSKWTMAGSSELPITVSAIATASSVKTTSEVTAANVVFTLAWEKPVLITFTIDDESYQAEEGMTWAGWSDSAYCTWDIHDKLSGFDTDGYFYYLAVTGALPQPTDPLYYLTSSETSEKVNKTDPIIGGRVYYSVRVYN